MSRTTIQRVSEPRGKQALSGLVMAGIAVVLLFAVIGVVSAGSFVASKMSSSTPTVTTKNHATGSSTAGRQEIARARAQATAILQSARAASNTIISRATLRARRQANTILTGARHKAAAIVAASSSSSGTASTGSSGPATGSGQAAGGTSSGATTFVPTPTLVPAQSGSGTTSSGSLSSGSTSSTAPAVTSPGNTTSTPPDLSSVPASWKVVGYGATFGSGPGSAGSITVTNRGDRTYAGTATVVYNGGGSASASFSGLAPGETEVLPLNGAAYGGGGYQIEVSVG